jgi:hypothetical protein
MFHIFPTLNKVRFLAAKLFASVLLVRTNSSPRYQVAFYAWTEVIHFVAFSAQNLIFLKNYSSDKNLKFDEFELFS